jgi:hypothetical protein
VRAAVVRQRAAALVDEERGVVVAAGAQLEVAAEDRQAVLARHPGQPPRQRAVRRLGDTLGGGLVVRPAREGELRQDQEPGALGGRLGRQRLDRREAVAGAFARSAAVWRRHKGSGNAQAHGVSSSMPGSLT